MELASERFARTIEGTQENRMSDVDRSDGHRDWSEIVALHQPCAFFEDLYKSLMQNLEDRTVLGRSRNGEGFLPYGFVADGFDELVASPRKCARGPAIHADGRSIQAVQQPGVVEERDVVGNVGLVVALDFRVDEVVGTLTVFGREHHHPDQLHISFHGSGLQQDMPS